MTRRNSVMCAPDSTDSPTASASSWMAVSTICSGRLVQAGVDDLHAGVAQGPGHHLRPAVVAVQAGLGDHDPYPRSHGIVRIRCPRDRAIGSPRCVTAQVPRHDCASPSCALASDRFRAISADRFAGNEVAGGR